MLTLTTITDGKNYLIVNNPQDYRDEVVDTWTFESKMETLLGAKNIALKVNAERDSEGKLDASVYNLAYRQAYIDEYFVTVTKNGQLTQIDQVPLSVIYRYTSDSVDIESQKKIVAGTPRD